MVKANPFTFKPVTKTNWSDFVTLFESKGCPSYCWCMPWRRMDKGKSRSSKSDKKATMKDLVDGGTPIGLLCYDAGEPVAWCSIASRESHRPLGGDETLDDVWSLTCFFIKREHRKQNLTRQLISEAMNYAKMNGAKYVEAYPVDPDSPSYRFMGFKHVFEEMSYQFVHKAGKRRHVMVHSLK